MTAQHPPKSKRQMMTHKQREVLVQEAKNKDIFAVAQQLGMKLQGNGKAEWEGHDSFWLDRKKNRFQWYGKGLWGDPVTLVSVIKFGARNVEDYKKNYRQSIAYLTNTEVPQFDSSKLPKSQPFKYRLKDDASMQLATDYLIHERGIALETVQFFKEKGVLAQSVWRNKRENGSILTEPIVVFKHFDGNNKMIGGSVQGIEYHPELHTDHKSGHLKRVLKNSGGYSGLVVDIGQPQRLVVCEAPIDLLSYYELHKETLKDVKLLSSDGYKPHVLSRYVAEMYGKSDFSLSEKEKFLEKFDKLSKNMSGYPKNLITFAYDNDEAGRGFIEQFKAQYPHAKNYVAVELPPLEKEKTKADWNDYLRRKKGKQMEKQHWNEKRIEEIVQGLYEQGGSYEYEGNLLGETYVEAYKRFKARYPEKELETMAQRLSAWTGEKVSVEEVKELRRKLEKNEEKQEKFSEVRDLNVRSRDNETLLKEKNSGNVTEEVIQKYEQVIQEQQASLKLLQSQFTELTKQNERILEKLNQNSVKNTEKDKNMEKIGSSSKVLAFVQIPQLIQHLKEKLSEVNHHLKDNIKAKSQKSLRITLEKIKVFESLETIQKGLESLSQKVQHLDTQLKVLSGQHVEKKELLLLPAPLCEAAEEIAKGKHIKIGESIRPRNKFEDRLTQAKIKNKQVAENYAKQKETHGKGVRHVQK
ncbi:toprim domain-containing protein [Lactococcus garvieae]|uniref:toprim domain-containing protein n=1 Tax=Lactococcus garvieae TaxID=1363 RepID=UPI003D774002